MYHRVIRSIHAEKIFVQPGMYVTGDSFQKQAVFLKKHFDVLPLAELVHRVESGQGIAGCCALTFDDGWLDNYIYAHPVLRELKLPATIFLATGFVGTQKLFWPEQAAYYLGQQEVLERGRADAVLKSFLNDLPEKGPEETRLDHAIKLLKAMTPAEREEVLTAMRGLSGAALPGRMLMNWDEVREMQSSGLIGFGAHSHNHVILDQVPLDQAEQEIIKSRQEMEKQLGVIPSLFAYPNGNYNADIQNLLQKHGFKAAVTTRKDWFNNKVSLFKIPRIGIHEDVSRTIPMFYARLLLKRF